MAEPAGGSLGRSAWGSPEPEVRKHPGGRVGRGGGIKEDRQGVTRSRKAGGQMAPRRPSWKAAVQVDRQRVARPWTVAAFFRPFSQFREVILASCVKLDFFI